MSQTATAAQPPVVPSRFPVPRVDDLPGDLAVRIGEMQEKMGFVPNVFLVLAHRPVELRAFLAYHDALMDSDEGLSKAEREMIVVATSAANQCSYCVVSHGAVLRIRSKNPRLGDQVGVNYRDAEVSPRQRAMLDYAVKLARTPWLTTSEDQADLEAHGFDREAVWDIGAITALFAMSNRLAAHTGMAPNHEFYAMAR